MQREHVLKLLGAGLVLATAVMAETAGAADAYNGGQLARRWCEPCHVVASDQRAVTGEAPPFFDGVTFRTYLLHELMPLRRVAGRLGANSARGGYERDESHCRENRFHRWSSMSPHSGVASTTRAERFARVAISMTGLWAEHLDPAQSTPSRAGLMKITRVACNS